MTKPSGAFRLTVAVVAWCAIGSAWSETFRCEADGKTIYKDEPCVAGRQSEIQIFDKGPSAADRAAAAARLRSDKAEAIAMQRDREKREQVERVAVRAGSDRGKQGYACAKLAVRAKRAHEDYDAAGPREQAKKRVRMLRSDEDYAALCKKR